MPRIVVFLFFLLAISFPGTAEDFGVRILLGITDTVSTVWDGSVTAQGATIDRLDPWRFEGTSDALLTGKSWKCKTHAARDFFAAVKPVVANGVLVYLKGAGANASVDVRTVQGNFTIALSEIPYGVPVMKLGNRVMVDRIPTVTQLTTNPQEQDQPAIAAGSNGEIWLGWTEFTHSAVHDQLRANFSREPANFNLWATPPGGDRIFVRRYAGGVWGPAIPVTNGGEDLYRPAVAVDGSGAVWVFWAANQGGDFDVWGRRVVNSGPQNLVRITAEAGSDSDPVAATDSQGRVWIAWQGWRGGHASIFTARQTGTLFTAPERVSSSQRNEWNPDIAASGDGRVSMAWDSYRNGNYDVYSRTAQSCVWGAETLVAGSARYEAYPSLAYAPNGTLWIAFEEGQERWGKDWGSMETSGSSLYSGRAIQVLGFDASGQIIAPTVSAGTVLPGAESWGVEKIGRQADLTNWYLPEPADAERRPRWQKPPFRSAPRNTSPRLHVDSSGRLWLAFRSAHPKWWPGVPLWHEYVVSYDGARWNPPVFLSQSDNVLDNRPGITTTGPGRLLVVGSSDRRRNFYLREKFPPRRGVTVRDPFNNDLFANEMSLTPGSGFLDVRPAAAPIVALPNAEDVVEREALDRIHAARPLGRYKVLVGEFHRHSEMSFDGGEDGSLLDQFRYAIDPAAMDWVGCCDHDNGGHREYPWWITQKLTDLFHVPGWFVTMFSYERHVDYPEGHRNVVFAQRGIHTLPRLPKSSVASTAPAPDTKMLYRYLRQFGGVTAVHTSATSKGTDWRNNDPVVETSVEIYQGERQNYERAGAPRANTATDSIGGYRPKGYVNVALKKGYKFGFEASSDHLSTHMSYANLLVDNSSRESILDAFKRRHLYGATDVILATVTSGQYIMGDIFATSTKPQLHVSLAGTAPFSKVTIVKNDKYVYTTQPGTALVDFTWQDTAPLLGKQSYYYVRGEQADGEIVWVSPMWITFTGN